MRQELSCKSRSFWAGSFLSHFPISVQCEAMEARHFLSSDGLPDRDLLNRLRTFTATAQDMATYDLELVDFGATQVYAKAGEWIAKLDLDAARGRPTAAAAVAQLGLGANLRRTLGEPDLALVTLPRSITHNAIQRRLNELSMGGYVEPNMVVVPTAEPNDPLYSQQWA